jgi:signal transduction histidine kinase
MAARLFDSFVTSKPQGMGLGLAISRSLIEQHEGRIWHEPAAEGGALFKFTLPAAPPGRKGAPP